MNESNERETVTCPRCGREEADPTVAFCPTCGSPLRGEPRRLKLRRRLTALLVVLTVISLVTTVVAVWARAVALDTDRFVDTVAPVIEEPSVQTALSVRLTDSIMSSLQIEDRVASALANVGDGELPVSPALLAGPITRGIEDALLKRTRQLIASDAVAAIWVEALRTAHSRSVALLRGDATNATIEGDAVYIDLLPVVNNVLAQLEQPLSDIFGRTIDIPTVTEANAEQVVTLLEQRFGVSLPADFGRVKVFESDALPAAQAAVVTVDRVVFLLVALTIVLAIASIVLSTRRLRTVLWLGFGAALGLIVVRRVALRLDDMIAARVTGETNRDAVQTVTSDVFGNLRAFTTLLLVAALVIGVAAYLAGRPAWLTHALERASDGTLIRRESPTLRWVGDHAVVMRAVLVALGAAALLFIDLSWASFLVVLVLLAGGWFLLTYLRDRVAGEAGVDIV
ncbi:MAG TPA: zinc ribbon domain-containing protein [Actinomycetota bacterium]|nr:zinc ribbon domain-containing protein [Actinomycetota bacterium]